MPRKGENIYKRKDGRWEGRYILSHDLEHKAKYAYVYGKTYSEVKRRLIEGKRENKMIKLPPKNSSTYNELLDAWLHSTQLNTKESTQARYAHLINTHIKPQLGISKTKIVITEPKSQCSVRDIPLPSFIIDIAKPFMSNPKAFILTGNDRYIEPRTMQNRFRSYVNESGIDAANFHALRHTFATRCVEVGFEIKSLSEVLGHANVNITLNRYVHSSFELKCSNMNKLSLTI